jgi:hypothetical protein
MKNVLMLEAQIAEWERINTKRRMVILSLPRNAHNEPNVSKAPAGIKILIREMMLPKPYFPKVDASPLEDEKVQNELDLYYVFFFTDHLSTRCRPFSCAMKSLRPSMRCSQPL